MNQIRLFCAECGKTGVNLYKNFCQSCHWKINKLADPKLTETNIPVCIECNSVKLPSGWQRFPDEEEMKTAISNASAKHLNVKNGQIVEMENSFIDWDLPKIAFVSNYVIEDDTIQEFESRQESYEIIHFLDKGICKSCTIKKSGARNVTVQLRAENRNLDSSEKERYRDIAARVVKGSSSDVNSNYLSKIEEYHGGLDFIFGNTNIAENFLYDLEKQVIGDREKNFKLVTEDKEGKRIYSITYLYRLPEFREGDYAGLDDILYRVENISSKGVHLFSLKDGQKMVIKNFKTLTLANGIIQVYKKIILSEDQNTNSYLIMDSSTFENEEVTIDNFRIKLPIGDELSFISWKNVYFLD